MMGRLLYDEAERAVLVAHLTKYYGVIERVLTMEAALAVPVEVAVIAPTAARPYRILATLGLGGYRMQVPEALRDYGLERAELVLCVPQDMEVEAQSWPVQWLAAAAQLAADGAWLGWGYMASLAQAEGFTGFLLMLPDDFGPKAASSRIAEHTDVHFYQMTPLYPSEAAYGAAHGANALIDQFDGSFSPVVDSARRSFV